MDDLYDEEECENAKVEKSLKQPTRNDLWELRKKYYSIYTSLVDKLPFGEVHGPFEYLKILHIMHAEAGIYAKVIKDIDKLLDI